MYSSIKDSLHETNHQGLKIQVSVASGFTSCLWFCGEILFIGVCKKCLVMQWVNNIACKLAVVIYSTESSFSFLTFALCQSLSHTHTFFFSHCWWIGDQFCWVVRGNKHVPWPDWESMVPCFTRCVLYQDAEHCGIGSRLLVWLPFWVALVIYPMVDIPPTLPTMVCILFVHFRVANSLFSAPRWWKHSVLFAVVSLFGHICAKCLQERPLFAQQASQRCTFTWHILTWLTSLLCICVSQFPLVAGMRNLCLPCLATWWSWTLWQGQV